MITHAQAAEIRAHLANSKFLFLEPPCAASHLLAPKGPKQEDDIFNVKPSSSSFYLEVLRDYLIRNAEIDSSHFYRDGFPFVVKADFSKEGFIFITRPFQKREGRRVGCFSRVPSRQIKKHFLRTLFMSLGDSKASRKNKSFDLKSKLMGYSKMARMHRESFDLHKVKPLLKQQKAKKLSQKDLYLNKLQPYILKTKTGGKAVHSQSMSRSPEKRVLNFRDRKKQLKRTLTVENVDCEDDRQRSEIEDEQDKEINDLLSPSLDIGQVGFRHDINSMSDSSREDIKPNLSLVFHSYEEAPEESKNSSVQIKRLKPTDIRSQSPESDRPSSRDLKKKMSRSIFRESETRLKAQRKFSQKRVQEKRFSSLSLRLFHQLESLPKRRSTYSSSEDEFSKSLNQRIGSLRKSGGSLLIKKVVSFRKLSHISGRPRWRRVSKNESNLGIHTRAGQDLGVRVNRSRSTIAFQDKLTPHHFSTNQSEQNLILDSNLSDLDDGTSSKFKETSEISVQKPVLQKSLPGGVAKSNQSSAQVKERTHNGPLRKLTEIPEREDLPDDQSERKRKRIWHISQMSEISSDISDHLDSNYKSRILENHLGTSSSPIKASFIDILLKQHQAALVRVENQKIIERDTQQLASYKYLQALGTQLKGATVPRSSLNLVGLMGKSMSQLNVSKFDQDYLKLTQNYLNYEDEAEEFSEEGKKQENEEARAHHEAENKKEIYQSIQLISQNSLNKTHPEEERSHSLSSNSDYQYEQRDMHGGGIGALPSKDMKFYDRYQIQSITEAHEEESSIDNFISHNVHPMRLQFEIRQHEASEPPKKGKGKYVVKQHSQIVIRNQLAMKNLRIASNTPQDTVNYYDYGTSKKHPLRHRTETSLDSISPGFFTEEQKQARSLKVRESSNKKGKDHSISPVRSGRESTASEPSAGLTLNRSIFQSDDSSSSIVSLQSDDEADHATRQQMMGFGDSYQVVNITEEPIEETKEEENEEELQSNQCLNHSQILNQSNYYRTDSQLSNEISEYVLSGIRNPDQTPERQGNQASAFRKDGPRFKFSNKLSSMNLFGTTRSLASKISMGSSTGDYLAKTSLFPRNEENFQNSIHNFERSPQQNSSEGMLESPFARARFPQRSISSRLSPSAASPTELKIEEETKEDSPGVLYNSRICTKEDIIPGEQLSSKKQAREKARMARKSHMQISSALLDLPVQTVKGQETTQTPCHDLTPSIQSSQPKPAPELRDIRQSLNIGTASPEGPGGTAGFFNLNKDKQNGNFWTQQNSKNNSPRTKSKKPAQDGNRLWVAEKSSFQAQKKVTFLSELRRNLQDIDHQLDIISRSSSPNPTPQERHLSVIDDEMVFPTKSKLTQPTTEKSRPFDYLPAQPQAKSRMFQDLKNKSAALPPRKFKEVSSYSQSSFTWKNDLQLNRKHPSLTGPSAMSLTCSVDVASCSPARGRMTKYEQEFNLRLKANRSLSRKKQIYGRSIDARGRQDPREGRLGAEAAAARTDILDASSVSPKDLEGSIGINFQEMSRNLKDILNERPREDKSTKNPRPSLLSSPVPAEMAIFNTFENQSSLQKNNDKLGGKSALRRLRNQGASFSISRNAPHPYFKNTTDTHGQSQNRRSPQTFKRGGNERRQLNMSAIDPTLPHNIPLSSMHESFQNDFNNTLNFHQSMSPEYLMAALNPIAVDSPINPIDFGGPIDNDSYARPLNHFSGGAQTTKNAKGRRFIPF